MAVALSAVQFLLLILWGTCTEEKQLDKDFSKHYQMFIGVEIMVLFGFGYLTSFMSRYGFGSVAFTLLITVVGVQWGVLTQGYFEQTYAGEYSPIGINLDTLLDALFLVATVLVSFGAVVGKIGPMQIIVLTIIEAVWYSINVKLFIDKGLLDIFDSGGTVSIHLFGGLFGMGLAFILGSPNGAGTTASSSTGEIFSMVGTLFLWIYWPSFNGGVLENDSAGQQRAVVNTILALCASTVGTFIVSVLCSAEGKIRIWDIQHATLAGGIAIGSVCSLTLRTSDSLLIGLAGGVSSAFFSGKVQPVLENRGFHDSCGIASLHVIPAIIGCFASVIVIAYKGDNDGDNEALEHGGEQWRHQFYSVILTSCLATISGILTGVVVKLFGPVESYFDELAYFTSSVVGKKPASSIVHP